MRLSYSVRARRDLERIGAYLEADNPHAATRVLKRIYTRIEARKHVPLQRRPGLRAGTRELVILRAPYIATYRVGMNVVTILAIRHTSRRPLS